MAKPVCCCERKTTAGQQCPDSSGDPKLFIASAIPCKRAARPRVRDSRNGRDGTGYAGAVPALGLPAEGHVDAAWRRSGGPLRGGDFRLGSGCPSWPDYHRQRHQQVLREEERPHAHVEPREGGAVSQVDAEREPQQHDDARKVTGDEDSRGCVVQ
jgi:hypothetical protein